MTDTNTGGNSGPRNQSSSRILLWIMLAVVIAAFAAFLVLRPSMPATPSNSPATPAK